MSGLGEILEENQRLRDLLAEKNATLTATATELAKKDAMLKSTLASLNSLEQQLEVIRLKHTRPVSQRFVPEEQQGLFAGDVAHPQDPVAETPELKPKRAKSGKKPRRRNRDSVKHLKARTIRCPATDDAACAKCGGKLTVIGQAESFRLDWVPGHFEVHDLVRDKCACRSCPGEGVLTVPAPYALERALCGDALLTRVLVDKFADHLPLNRQMKRMGREGLEIATNTLSSWVKQGAQLLRPLGVAVRKDLMAGRFIQGDDTGFPVQDTGNGRLRKGRLWAFTDQQHVFYAFSPTKEGQYPAQLLSGFGGDVLLVDGGSEFNRVVAEKQLERAGCWSHLRTYFFRALTHHPLEAKLALGTIRELFMVERELHGRPPDEVVRRRAEDSKPLVDGLFNWTKHASTYVRPDSLLGKAIGYARSQEASLRVHLDHGDLPMHNNLSELMLRQAVVGRKNWLFARSEGGADAAATLYTLIGSCMLQGIDPQVYLTDVFRRLPDHASNRVNQLIPREWRLQRQGHTSITP